MSAIATRVAAARLDERERRALELRERAGAGYAAIAADLGVPPREVATLLVAARLRVREAVRDRPLPALESDDCRRARPLLGARQDGEALAAGDREFLRGHVDGCGSCRSARMALREGSLALQTALETDPEAFGPVPALSPAAVVAEPEPERAAVAETPIFMAPAAPPVAPELAAPEPARAPVAAKPARAAKAAPARRRVRRAPAIAAVAVIASFVGTMTTIFLGGDDPGTSSAAPRPQATAEPTATPSAGTAVDSAAAERRAERRRAARLRRERAQRRRRRARQAAAAATATATPAPAATTAPEPEATPAPQRQQDRRRQTPRKPTPQPDRDEPEPQPGGGGGTLPPVPTDNPDGKPDVIPDSCSETNPDCDSG